MAPVVAPTVATPGEPLLHVPPEVASVKVPVAPRQIEVVPPIVAGVGLTVTTVVEVDEKHPLVAVKV